MFQSVQCKNVLQRVQLLVTVHLKWKQILHQVRQTYGKLYMSKMESMTIMNSHNIHLLSNV